MSTQLYTKSIIYLGHSIIKCKNCSMSVHLRCYGIKNQLKQTCLTKNTKKESKEPKELSFECDLCTNTDKEKVN